MQRFCFSLELKNDSAAIERYLEHHRAVWPEVLESIRSAGVLQMEIYRAANRLFMVMETNDDFTLEQKAAMDRENAKIQEWERLMEQYQLVPDGVSREAKWQPMQAVFSLQP